MVLRVRCVCGKEAPRSVDLFGRPFLCRICRARCVVVWGIDPKSQKAIPLTLEAPASPEGGFKVPAGMFELPCPCGQRLYARPKQAGKRVQCPVCGHWLKLERTKDPQTLETRIRVVKSRLNQLPAMPPPKPSPAEANRQDILCSCGESFPASGNQARCPACGTRLRLEVKDDTETACIVIDPKLADKALLAEKRGIDEDLSLDDFQ